MKKVLKTVITAVLTAVMIFSAVPCAAGETALPFGDVEPTDYFYEAVVWAYSEGVTTGTTETEFSPLDTCTRGQVVTFLWRAVGEPEPEGKDNPFSDVKESEYYSKPILWAVENGITNGTAADRFSPDATCSNAHILTFIWRAMGEPDKTGNGEWYTDACEWAENGGLLDGTYTGGFRTDADCPRANVVTYLYRYLNSNTLTIYVLAGADAASADGSAQKPFATIEAARDAIRGIDKTGYTGINVRIKSGVYYLKDTVTFTKDDSGTKDCPITYIGEDGTVITGGVTLSAKNFTSAKSKTKKYFTEEALPNIVETDLKKYGITKELVAEKFAQDNITYATLVPLYIDGKLATIARYPNEGYEAIAGGKFVEVKPGATDPNERFRTTVTVSDEMAARIAGWHDTSTVFTLSCHVVLWRPNNYRIMDVDKNTLYLTYGRDWYGESVPGTYTPLAGRPIVFENIPEELDAPGEYYVDKDAILYIYKTENFDSAHISLPVAEKAFEVNGADYLTMKNLVIESFANNAITAKADNFSLKNCEIRGIGQSAVDLVGSNITVSGCDFHDISFTALSINGGDCNTLTPSNNLIYDNSFHEWGQVNPFYSPAVNIRGCGTVVSHNEMYNAGHEAITWEGNNNIIEFNEIYDVCNITDDAGAVYSYNSYAHYGNVIRYNYIHDIRCKDEFLANIDGYNYCDTSAIYIDGGKSGQTVQYNILENVTGCGVTASGRDEIVTNNLFISCGTAVSLECAFYQGEFGVGQSGGGKSGQQFAGQENNTYWQKAFPSLYKLKWEKDENSANDPDYYACPAGIVMKDNYFYFDRAIVRSFKWYGHAYTNIIHEAVYRFSGENIVDAVEGVNQTMYSSKRTPITAADVIEETSEITGITMEMFNKIGRVTK